MSVNWGDYEPFDPGVDRSLSELPRKERGLSTSA
jgi:hypothetical protein